MMQEKPSLYNSNSGIAVCPSINAGFINDGGITQPGYNPEFIGKEVLEMPPSAPLFEIPTQKQLPQINLGTLSEYDIREACLQYASENCCYGKKFIRDTTLPEITETAVYHYMLESFGEKRQTVERAEPYRGQVIDGPENGHPPRPWDMLISLPSLFRDSQAKAEVPHTAYVKECYRCVGNCRIRCENCEGRGGNLCLSCFGTGRNSNESCSSCQGNGRQRCWTCNGTGQEKCPTCDGRGRLKHYKLLLITWKNHVENFVSSSYTLPKNLIMTVAGRKIFDEQNPKVLPLTYSDNMLVNEASKTLLSKHERSFPQELIRMQRHSLRVVPLTKVKYSWKNKTGDFYVYGFEKKVYFENYPQKCCCCTCC